MQSLDYLFSNSEAWLQYAIKTNLLHEKKEDLLKLKNKALCDTKIQLMLEDINDFHNMVVSNHKNPKLPIHKLIFLLDIGFDMTEKQISNAITRIMEHKDEKGVYQSRINVPKHFGGSGEDTYGWALCDAPLLFTALVKANVDYEKHIKQGVDYLAALSFEKGYPCCVSGEFGKFRGPGRKDDPCPYATLVMLKLFAEIPMYQQSELACVCANSLLSLWENSIQKHPYMFYMGTDFRKLKAPSVWYDIISVADALSQFDEIKEDKRFLEMLSIIKNEQEENGLFIPQSIYQSSKGWDFGQKKEYSPYLTYLCMKIFQRTKMQMVN